MRILRLILGVLMTVALWGAEVLPEGRVRVRAYGEDLGLGSMNIQAMGQDREGYLYVGTAAGLYRFDGSRFVLIPLREDLAAPSVLTLLMHPDGGMWVGTMNGLAWVQGTTVRWATMEGTLNNLSIFGLALDGEGRAWFPDRRGMFRQAGATHFQVDPATQSWSKEGLVLARPAGGRQVVALDAKGGLHRLEKPGAWSSEPLNVPMPEQLLFDTAGGLWYLRRSEVRMMAPGSSRFDLKKGWLRGSLAESGVVAADPQGGIWVPTTLGLQQLADRPLAWIDRTRGLPEEDVNFCFNDREGNLWFGGVGLYRRLARGWMKVFDRKDGLPGNVIWAIHRGQRSGRLLVGAQSGVSVLGAGRFESLPGTEDLSVSLLHEDASGDLWIGTRTGGLLRQRAGERAARRVAAFQGDGVFSMAVAPDGKIWITGDKRGLVRMTPGANPDCEVVKVPRSPTGPGGAARVGVDALGRIWIGTWYGVHVLDQGQWRSFTTKDGLRMDSVLDVFGTPDGDIWIRYEEPVGASRARYEQGVFRVLETLDRRHGLPTDVAFGAYGHSGGDVSILTDRGLLARRGGILTQLTVFDGLPTNDCDENAFFEERDGTLWLGTSQGLVRLAPGALAASRPAPVTRIVGLSALHRAWLLPSEWPSEKIRHEDASLTFRFAPEHFAEEAGVRAQVRLQGLEEDWRTVEDRSVRYPGLREGTYTFHVRSARPGEAWGPVATMTVQVAPPWFRAWWAYVIWLSVLGMAVIGAVRLRLRAITHQRDVLEQLVRERTQEIETARGALEVVNEALRNQSLTDPLTGLRNRRFLDVALPQDVRKSVHLYRNAGKNGRRGDLHNPDLVFVIVDMDFFKKVNDVHGHHAGDLVLQQVAEILRQAMRDTDAIVRWGGEEFLIVARETDRWDSPRLAERVRSMIATHPFEVGLEKPLSLTCSLGFAPFPMMPDAPSALDWERVVDLADHCLYVAKRSGRNGWVGVVDCREVPELPWGPAQLKALSEGEKLDLMSSFHTLNWQV